MHKWTIIASIFLMSGLLVACKGISSTTEAKLIEPGDKIGDFTITTGVQGDFTFGFAIPCTEAGAENSYTCNAQVGESVNVSTGLRDTTGSGNLDAVWEKSNYQLFINDWPVDLSSFGTLDYNHPTAGMIRFANVVITADKPGEITVRDAGLFDNGDPFSSTSTYIFTEP